MTSATPKAEPLESSTANTAAPDEIKALESGVGNIHNSNGIEHGKIVSQDKVTPPATSPPGDEKPLADQTNNTASGASTDEPKPSNSSVKRFFGARDWAGSTTSSRRSHNASAKPLNNPQRPSSVDNSANNKPKRGLLAILGCCGSKDDPSDIDMKEVPRVQQQSTSNSPVTRSQRLKARLDRTASQEAKAAAASQSNEKSAAAASVPSTPTDAKAKTDSKTAQEIAARATAASAIHTDTPDSALSATPDVMVQAPTPVIPQQDHGEQIISDRTPEQEARDTDIEMTDVGPSIPLSSNEAASRPTSTVPTIDNPIADNKSELTASTIEQSAISVDPLTNTENEVPKGLLPAIRPEHRGRKCLILDLDETLVHSSFKVCTRVI